MNKFQGGWTDYEDFCRDFEETKYIEGQWVPDKGSAKGLPTEDEIILARCDEDSYEGSCCVYYRRDGKVYEEELSHCSCNCYRDDQNWAALVPITREYMDARDKAYRSCTGDAEVWAQLKEACFPTLREIVA